MMLEPAAYSIPGVSFAGEVLLVLAGVFLGSALTAMYFARERR